MKCRRSFCLRDYRGGCSFGTGTRPTSSFLNGAQCNKAQALAQVLSKVVAITFANGSCNKPKAVVHANFL